jgi:uncharacterized protein (TIGR04222 family)
MDWLIENPIANMYGPYFLLFYGSIVAITLFLCWRKMRSDDWTVTMPLPAVPSTFDPYEMAYLRGGENEVTRAVIFALLQRGFLTITEDNSEQYIEQVSTNLDRHQLSIIERRVFDWFSTRRSAKNIFNSDGLTPHLKSFCVVYEQRLQSERLLTPDDIKTKARGTLAVGALIIVGLGAYKFMAAIINGFYNVFFLLVIGGVGVYILRQVCKQPRVSARGNAYLKRLQLAFENLKTVPTAASPTMASVDPMLMLVGLYGAGVLADSVYDPYRKMFSKGSSNSSCGSSSCSSGCGSSCGSSGGSSCGGGCGGCGGGD